MEENIKKTVTLSLLDVALRHLTPPPKEICKVKQGAAYKKVNCCVKTYLLKNEYVFSVKNALQRNNVLLR